MTQPSNLKVKRLLELDALPVGAVDEAWMYAVVGGNPNRDHKVLLSDLIVEATDLSLDVVRDELLTPDAGEGADMIAFKQDDSQAVVRTVHEKLTDFVTAQDFGAVGDGVTDDSAAILKAAAHPGGVDFGDKTYRLASGITIEPTHPIRWRGNGARFVFDGTLGTDLAFYFNMNGNNLTLDGRMVFDGNNKCARPIYIRNASDTHITLNARDIEARNAVRESNSYAAGIAIQGAFEVVDINNARVSNITTATSGGLGVAGIIVISFNLDRYVRTVFAKNLRVEGVYKVGWDATTDQDGIRIFGPDAASANHPHKTAVFVGGHFLDCAGRAIKTQTDHTEVNGVKIERRAITAVPAWGTDIDVQTGGGFVRGVEAIYTGSVPVNVILVNSTVATYKDLHTASVSGVHVYNETAESIASIVRVTNRENTKPMRGVVNDLQVKGLHQRFVSTVGISTTSGVQIMFSSATGQPSVAAVDSTGATSTGRIVANGIINLGAAVPFYLRANITQDYLVDAHGCFGWLEPTSTANNSLQLPAALRPYAIGSRDTPGGAMQIRSGVLTNGTVTDVGAWGRNNTALYLLIIADFSSAGVSLFSVNHTSGSPGVTVVYTAPSVINVAASDPGSGNFRVYPSGGTLKIENQSGTTREFTLLRLG